MNIGTIIESRRKELNLTLETIGNYVGVGKSTVKKWENGHIENMKRDKIALLSEVLHLSPITFITGEFIPLATENISSTIYMDTTRTPLQNPTKADKIHSLFDNLNTEEQLQFFNELKIKISTISTE